MEIGAHLHELEIGSSDPEALAAFYRTTFRLQVHREGAARLCLAPGRSLRFVPGSPGELKRVTYAFKSRTSFERFRERIGGRTPLDQRADDGCTVVDPLGQRVSFIASTPERPVEAAPSARLQHVGMRVPAVQPMIDFYAGALGFIVSDRVVDGDGELTAAFLRTDHEHHSLALFRAPEQRFDHFSCEVPGWSDVRDWADHMAANGVDLAWGVGRHGPGNDTFLMVRDPDGNLGEISSDLEVCEPGRPCGTWPHRPQTLNQWGVAIMRS